MSGPSSGGLIIREVSCNMCLGGWNWGNIPTLSSSMTKNLALCSGFWWLCSSGSRILRRQLFVGDGSLAVYPSCLCGKEYIHTNWAPVKDLLHLRLGQAYLLIQ